MTVAYHIESKQEDYLDGLLKKAKAQIVSFTDIDPLFDTAGEIPGIEIWRIEKLKLTCLDKQRYGEFYDADCYVVLATTTTSTGKIVWDLHYWRGNKASIDKAFVCAIKACELHRHLRHQSKQYREVQGQESDLFKEYFTKMTILAGGTPSALRVMKKPILAPRLFQVKGTKGQVVVKLVNLHHSSLNSGDVFVLEMEDIIFQWTGKQSSLYERATALEFTSHLKLFRPKSKQLEILYEDHKGSSNNSSETAMFWSNLKGKPRTIKTANEGGCDKVHSNKTIMELYRIHESKGIQEVSLVETRYMPATKTIRQKPTNKPVLANENPQPFRERKLQSLKQESVYLLDCDLSLYLWYGKYAPIATRKAAREMAKGSTAKFAATSIPIIKVLPANPVPEFWINFVDRHTSFVTSSSSSSSSSSSACVIPVFAPDYSIQTIAMPVPVNLITAQKKLTSQRSTKINNITPIFEDNPGEGELLIWRVDKVAMVQLTNGHEGIFNSGYSYIIIYSYQNKNHLCHLVYYWEGKHRPCGSWLTWKWDLAPQLISGLENATGGIPPTCERLVQGKETQQFYSLFQHEYNKQLIIFNATLPQETPKLFTVCGIDSKMIVGKEVKCCASTLSSGQVSVLLCENEIYIWYGVYANAAEREVGERVCERLRVCENISEKSVQRIQENSEPESFWQAIGGKKTYWRLSEREGELRMKKETNSSPRVFRCVNNEKTLVLEEMQQYSDQDLEEREIFIVLAYGKVYLWRGNKVRSSEEVLACSLIIRHLEYTKTPRQDFIKERAGAESLAFRSIFGMWDANRPFEDPYLPKMEKLYELGVIGREVPIQPRTKYPVKSIEERSWWLRPTHVPK